MKNNKKSAFTLAEILVTLVIIGIIAAVTIPAINNRLEKQDTVAKLKAAYSIVSQGVNKAWIDNGPISYWDLRLNEEAFADKYIKPYFLYTKICKSMSDGCWHTDGFNGYYDLKGDKITKSVPYSLILNNGMILGVNRVAGSLLSYIVDINGQRKPNKMGRDIFSFYVYNSEQSFCNDAQRFKGKDGLYLGGYDYCGPPHAFYSKEELLSLGVARSCNKQADNGGGGGDPGTRAGAGTACAAVIAKDGWKISKDYPW